METLLPTQPEENKYLLKRSLILYKRSFKYVFLFSLILSFIIFIPRIISLILGYEFFGGLSILNPKRLLLLLVIAIFGMIFFIAILWRIFYLTQNKKADSLKAILVGVRKTIPATFAVLVQGAFVGAITAAIFGIQIVFYFFNVLFMDNLIGIVFTMCVFLLELILITYVFNLFYFTAPIIALENLNIILALEKSLLLVWDHWWRTFSLQVVPWLYYLLALLILKIFLDVNIYIYLGGFGKTNIQSVIVNFLLFAIFVPWFASLLLVQFKDLELRRILKVKNVRRKRT